MVRTVAGDCARLGIWAASLCLAVGVVACSGGGSSSSGCQGPSGSCSSLLDVGGRVSGLTGGEVRFVNNGADLQTFVTNDLFQFDTALPDGSSYDVRITDQPTGPVPGPLPLAPSI